MIELETKGKIFIVFLIILGSTLFLATRSTPTNLPANIYDGSSYIPGTVEGFYNTPPQDIEHLLQTNPSVVVVDCSTSGADFLAGRKLPGAVWSPDAKIYYGQNMELVLYSTPDEVAINYARSLVGKVYGHIYVLTGGQQAWANWINSGA